MFVYILTNKRNGTLYTGVTADVAKRIWQHRNGIGSDFTRRHHTHLLVYYEQHETHLGAITREKQIKKWNRAWKLELIEGLNPKWHDLYETLLA